MAPKDKQNENKHFDDKLAELKGNAHLTIFSRNNRHTSKGSDEIRMQRVEKIIPRRNMQGVYERHSIFTCIPHEKNVTTIENKENISHKLG